MTTTIILASAVLASLALGIVIAYGICKAMFMGFRIHTQMHQRSRARAASAPRAEQKMVPAATSAEN